MSGKNGWKCLGVDEAKDMIDYGIKNFNLDLKRKMGAIRFGTKYSRLYLYVGY